MLVRAPAEDDRPIPPLTRAALGRLALILALAAAAVSAAETRGADEDAGASALAHARLHRASYGLQGRSGALSDL